MGKVVSFQPWLFGNLYLRCSAVLVLTFNRINLNLTLLISQEKQSRTFEVKQRKLPWKIDLMVFLECSHSKDLKIAFDTT